MHIRTIRELGGIIRQTREDTGLTQAALAERLGVRRQRILYLERGEGEMGLPFVFSVLRELGLMIKIQREAIDVKTDEAHKEVPAPYDIDTIVDESL